MAYVATQGLLLPAPPAGVMSGTAPALTSSVIDATGEKFSWIGNVWNKDRATKSIRKVHFLFGTVTKAGGSAMTVSLQNVDLANGPPHQPDGTQDQTVAIANADAGFVTNAYYATGAFSADRSVAFGERLAVVIEYDGAGRLSSDVVNLRNIGVAGSTHLMQNCGCVLLTASWAMVNVIPNILLEFSDGTFGTLDGAFPVITTPVTVGIDSGTTPDEVALQFSVPFVCKIDGAWIHYRCEANTSDADVVLYEGTTALQTVAVDANAVSIVGSNDRIVWVTFPETTLTPGTTYYLAVKPGTTNDVRPTYHEVAAAAHFDAHAGGQSFTYSTRTDGGSWAAPTATRRPFAGIRISALSDTETSAAVVAKVIGS